MKKKQKQNYIIVIWNALDAMKHSNNNNLFGMFQVLWKINSGLYVKR